MNADSNDLPQEELNETPVEVAVEASPSVDEGAAPWFAGVDKLLDASFDNEGDPKVYGEMLSKLTPDDIAGMPPGAQAAIRAAREHARYILASERATIDSDRKRVASELARAQAEGARITREGAQLNALLTSPEIRRLREAPAPGRPDLTTAAGQKAYFDSLIGAKINEAFGPVVERAEVLSGQAAWLDLQDRMPEFKDSKTLPEFGKTFLREVESRQEAQEAAKRPVTDTETMALLVLGELARKREGARIQNERQARAQAAANIQRPAGGRATAPKTIPPEVIRTGKIGEWLRSNPDYQVAQ